MKKTHLSMKRDSGAGATSPPKRAKLDAVHPVEHIYRTPALIAEAKDSCLRRLRRTVSPAIRDLRTEFCFNVGLRAGAEPLTAGEVRCARVTEAWRPARGGVAWGAAPLACCS
jgi:hypothetical protein